MMRQIGAWLLLAVMLITMAGCGTEADVELGLLEMEKTAYSREGMEIQLPEAFRELDVDGYTVCFETTTAAIFTLKEPFTLAEGVEKLSVREYADMVYAANAVKSPSAVTEEEGLVIMEYTFFVESEGTDFVYLTSMYKASDAFWMIQFTCKKENYAEYRPHFVEWAKSVTFQ
jgi:hypothetical protein